MAKQLLKFKKLDEKAVIPSYAHVGDCGMDVTATSIEYDQENDMYICHTGLACEMAKGYALLCLPRSSNTKLEIYMPNSPGLVDPATYRGEIQFRYKMRDSSSFMATVYAIVYFLNYRFTNLRNILFGRKITETVEGAIDFYNDYNKPLEIFPFKAGERVGQFLVVKTTDVKVEEVNELSETTRGTGGFGSTNK